MAKILSVNIKIEGCPQRQSVEKSNILQTSSSGGIGRCRSRFHGIRFCKLRNVWNRQGGASMADEFYVRKYDDIGGFTQTPVILTAVRKGDIDTVRRLLDEGHDPSDREDYYAAGCGWDYGCSLGAAVRRDDIPMVRLLLSRGAVIEEKTLGEDPPLALAMENNNFEMVKLLIEHGAKVTGRYDHLDYEKTPFNIALRHSSQEIIELLLEKGASIPRTGWLSNNEVRKVKRAIEDDDLEKAGDIMSLGSAPWDDGIADAVRRNDHRKLQFLLSLGIKPEDDGKPFQESDR